MKFSSISFRKLLITAATVCLLGAVSPKAQAGIADYSAEEHIERALEFQKEDKLKAAIIELKNAIKLQPKNAYARITLGNVLLEVGDIVRATNNFERARSLGAPTAGWIAPLAQSWLRLGRFEEIGRASCRERV